jgi:iron complex transport system ATP-binding protein
MSVVLRGEGLTYAIGAASLVDGIDVEARAGEVLALAGPNGAGKSTLLRLLAGELEPTRGSVELGGRPLAGISPGERARLRAVMPQETLLQFAFTVREVVEMGRHPHRGADSGRDGEAVESAMRWTEVNELQERTFPTLSGGERSRTTLARVLAQEAPLLLLDEPTGALDIRHQERAMTVARSFADSGGAVVAVLHDLNLAAAYADRIALLDRGSLAAVGTPWDVLREDVLGAVFAHPVRVLRSPWGDAPLVVPERLHLGEADLDALEPERAQQPDEHRARVPLRPRQQAGAVASSGGELALG